jgi:hypothetical protein
MVTVTWPRLLSVPVGGFEVAFDLTDFNPDCDNNRWRGNTYGTAQKPCVTIGGTQVGGAATASSAAQETSVQSTPEGTATTFHVRRLGIGECACSI